MKESASPFWDTLSPEFRLAVATCVWPRGPYRTHRIATALDQRIDWDLFLRVAQRQRMQGLAYDGLSKHVDRVPEATMNALQISASRLANKSVLLAGETVRITRKLQAAGIPSACLKGASLSTLTFGDVALRHSRDIDLLVQPSDVSAADEVLQAAGYRMTMPIGPHTGAQKRMWTMLKKHFEYEHAESGRQLELHWRLSDNPGMFTTEIQPSSWVDVPVAGSLSVPGLPRREMLLHLCVHGASHMWCRLKWIADIGALLAQEDGDAVRSLQEDATIRGCLRSVNQALLLSHQLFHSPAVDLGLSHDRTARLLVKSAIEAMTQGDAAVEVHDVAFGTTRIALARLRLKRDWKFRFDELRFALVDESDRQNLRLPPSLWFLSPVVRVPLWIGRRMSGAGRSNRG
jgi:hypothetical protein